MKSVMNIEFFDPPRNVCALAFDGIDIQHPFHLAGIRYCINKRQRTTNDVLQAHAEGCCNKICQRQRPPRLGARAGTAENPQFVVCQRAGEDQITQLLQEQRRVLIVMIFRTHNHMAGPRRQLHHASLSQRLFGKGVVAFIEQRLQQRMFRMVRLQHHFALFTRTPGTTGDWV